MNGYPGITFPDTTPTHFLPNDALCQWLTDARWKLTGKDHGCDWVFTDLDGKCVAHYFPSTAKLHLYKDGAKVPTEKFDRISPQEVLGVLRDEFRKLDTLIRTKAGQPPRGVLSVGRSPTPAEMLHQAKVADQLDEKAAAFTQSMSKLLPPYAPEDTEATLRHHQRTADIPREEIPRKELRRNARVKILASLVAAQMSNPSCWPATHTSDMNVEVLVDKARSALAAIEASVDRDPCDVEDLHGK